MISSRTGICAARGAASGRATTEAYQTLYTVLTTVTRLMAPALPFLTEEIYQNLVRSVDPAAPESVHLTRIRRWTPR